MTSARFLQALQRKSVDRVPVWFMRQAGRYLPEYRALRAKAGSFMQLCQTPEYACEVTLQPLRRFGFDAAILFSDILTVPDAMGLGLKILENEGPVFDRPVRTAKDIQSLPVIDPRESLSYVMQAVALLKRSAELTVPLIGFAGSPWTVATYMVEGRATKNFSVIKKMLYREPALLHALLDRVAVTTAAYLQMQIDAGADAVMLFDSWGGVLTPSAHEDFSLRYIQKIIQTLRASSSKEVPVIVYGKQTHAWLEKLAETGCDALGIDWTIDIAEAKRRVGERVALQGNLDPCVLYADSETIEKEVLRILKSVGHAPGFVFNLGHGIYPDVPIESVEIVLETVRNFCV